jgi:Amt family ammonium transporter
MSPTPPDCSSVTGAWIDVCNYITTLIPATPPSCADNQYLGTPFDNATLGCISYSSPIQKSAGMLGDQGTIDTGNTAWMLVATAFVMIMTPGVGLFYAGLAGESSASNTILMSFAALAIVSVQWYLFGYSFAFGPGTDGWGSFQWGALTDISYQPSAVYGWAIPHIVFVVFQCMFAAITPALISGSVIGRFRFTSFCVFVFIWTTLVYDPVAHWVWSATLDDNYAYTCLGFLCRAGALDFAGGTVIHITSGFAGLACSIQLGKRYNFGEKIVPHNTPMIVIGASLVWFGWFGFNAGSALAAASPIPGPSISIASVAFWNTHLAASAAALSWMFFEKIITKSTGPAGAAAGAVAGLVAITRKSPPLFF